MHEVSLLRTFEPLLGNLIKLSELEHRRMVLEEKELQMDEDMRAIVG